ncbi:MAG: M28 family peptidase [Chitinispirillaceae bacterium]|nr:M28 family peptidase [Chitinispirillaceae bacterium]
MNNLLLQKTEQYLHTLCNKIPNRAVGSPGNIAATDYFRESISPFGWDITSDPLEVMDWNPGIATISIGSETLQVKASPYASGCESVAELICVSTIQDLENSDVNGKNLLLFGDITIEQLMPRNFVFYNPEEHRRIISTLETKKPSCIICATGRNSSLAGGAYPFPLIEDGDFNIPSVYFTDVEGEYLRKFSGEIVKVKSSAARISSRAYNITALKKSGKKRIVITAHIDAKKGTPGAIDNGTGVTVLLLLAELLSDYTGKYSLELVALNGEDYYAVPGQMDFIRKNDGQFGDIALNINIDGQGYFNGKTAFSFNGLSGDFKTVFDEILESSEDAESGPWWPQGDHSIFVQYGVPAVAVSSSWFLSNMENQTITHTEADNLSIVDFRKVLKTAELLSLIIRKMTL